MTGPKQYNYSCNQVVQLSVFILLLFNSINVSAEDVAIEILSYGIYEPAPTTSIKVNKSVATGYTSSTSGYNHIKSTHTIPVVKCSSFGLKYNLTGLSDVDIDFIDVEIRHPRMKYHLGGETTYSNAKMGIYPENGNYEGHVVYILRQSYELLPGKWRFNLSYKEKLLLSMDFTLQASDLNDETIECI